MKKIISLFLSLVMVISAVCIADFSAFAEDKPIMAKTASLYADNESGSDTMIEDTLYYSELHKILLSLRLFPKLQDIIASASSTNMFMIL